MKRALFGSLAVGALVLAGSVAQASSVYDGSFAFTPFSAPSTGFSGSGQVANFSFGPIVPQLVVTSPSGTFASPPDVPSTFTTFAGATLTTSPFTLPAVNQTSTNPIVDFLVFATDISSASPPLPSGDGTDPQNRFHFTLTSLTRTGQNSISGTGIMHDTVGAFADESGIINMGWSSTTLGNYSGGFASELVPVPLPAAAGVGFSMLGGFGFLAAFRKRLSRRARIA
jgi:hypothetical protein